MKGYRSWAFQKIDHCSKPKYSIPAVIINSTLISILCPILNPNSTPTTPLNPSLCPLKSRKPHDILSHIIELDLSSSPSWKPDHPRGLCEHHFLRRPIQVKASCSSHPPHCRVGGRPDDSLLDLAASRPLFTVLVWFLSGKQQKLVIMSTFNSVEPPRGHSFFEKKNVATKNGSILFEVDRS